MGNILSGCIPDGQGGYQADGLFNNGKPHLAGVQVQRPWGSALAVRIFPRP